MAERGCWAGGAGLSSWPRQATHDVPSFTWKLRAGEHSLCLTYADVNLQPGCSRYTVLAKTGTVFVLRISQHSHLLASKEQRSFKHDLLKKEQKGIFLLD